ncbi:hypothetical protein MON38_19825 [Hymenobacter sp. DH14]|uniref:DUF4105 domain-containing protein n=1 Tax=Hymenobacter cyanobacteriorum TaxID=2926463 RepID=A0A9X1VK92_9BACT|nr:hypothetical protein [Hymenobacter cyanobacteriorum]MCI1189677.1 hypothetical protein [Hymenobacter cyanobacteriorum]
MNSTLSLLLLWGPAVRAQQPAPASAASLLAFQQAHLGRILFSATRIPPTGYADDAHYIGYHAHTLTPKSSLYLTAFLTTSLPDALARLAPDAQRTDFMKRGSFQYCFYVDNELVYTAYLQPEPQYLIEENAQPVLHQPVLAPETSRRKSQSLWANLLANGGKKALAEGSHMLRLVIRPYIQSPLLQVGPVLADGQVALNVTRHAAPARAAALVAP